MKDCVWVISREGGQMQCHLSVAAAMVELCASRPFNKYVTTKSSGALNSWPVTVHMQEIAYFSGKTTYSNRKYDIIDPNKWLI